MSIFEKGKHLDPDYDHLDRYCDVAYKSIWTPAKYLKNIKRADVPEVKNTMDLVDRQAIERCILAVILVEDKVKLYWPTTYFDFPQTIIGDVGGMFGQMEVTHRKSYSALAKELGLDLDQANSTKQLNARIKYLNKHLEEDPTIIGDKRKLKRLVLFTSLVERCSLFTQFYILMSYCNANRGLQHIASLQQSTALEELFHYNFGVELINIIKKQKPQIWTDYLVDLVNKNIKAAYKAELKLIDWFFEAGVPEHLSKEEVVNFLNYNFNQISEDLELPSTYKYDQEMYDELNSWMLIRVMSSEPDFFNAAVGGYSSTDEDEFEDIFG